jgi:hypothetical protein
MALAPSVDIKVNRRGLSTPMRRQTMARSPGYYITKIAILVAALHEWKCPACGGRGRYIQRWIEREPQTIIEKAAGLPGKPVLNPERHQEVECTKCKGTGLHPTAQTALKNAEEVIDV